MAPEPQRLSGSPHWSPSLLILNLLFIPEVSILLEQMVFWFSQNAFFLILTSRISWMALPPAPLTSTRGHAANDS